MSHILPLFTTPLRSANVKIDHPLLEKNKIALYLKREDLLHEHVSGNKFRKLKYNLIEAKQRGFKTLLTFGGAFSNHIAATAAAGKMLEFNSIGVIRGEELKGKEKQVLATNNTLRFAKESGMQLHYISREQYRDKESPDYLESLRLQFGDFYLIPEGGTNQQAVNGCKEILSKEDSEFNSICCAVGTGGTISGIINSSAPHQTVLGFPALKGNFLATKIKAYAQNTNWDLITNYHFGGYGKINVELITFINTFYAEQQIRLDPVYTAKMMYGIFDMIRHGYFKKNTRILAIHTGGLQGISGMNKKLQTKKLPVIKT